MSWAESIYKFIALGRYTSIAPNLVDGALGEARLDANGRLLVSLETGTTLWDDGAASKSEKIVKNTTGKLYQIFGRNTGAAVAYVFIFNTNARPANGSTAHLFTPIKVDAGAWFSIELDRPRALSAGLYWGASSSDATFTYAAGATLNVAAEYA